MTDLSKCRCKGPGLCPVFKRVMGTDPPDWAWCQRSTEEERKSFYRITSREKPTVIEKLAEEYENLNYDPAYFYLYILINERGFHNCNKSKSLQDEKFRKIVELSEKNKQPADFSQIEIFCLGHSPKQFEDFPQKDFLKPLNLNELDAGRWSDNKWAETRAFIPKDLFTKPFIGTTTVSWNTKYEPLTIEHFDQWATSRLLLNSAPEDKVILCADMFCPCCWIQDDNSILSIFFSSDANEIGQELLRMFGLELQDHVRVPFGNQLFAHRSVFEDYRKFLFDNNVLGMVEEFTDSIKTKIKSEGEITQNYHNNRIPAYFMEMISCFWLAKQNYLYVPNVKRRHNWYHPDNVKERMNKWSIRS